MNNLSSYVSDIERIYAAGGATEHSYRPALQTLVQSLERNITALNEPKRIAAGAPDFRISRANVPIGYIETKDIGLSLDRIEDDEQLTRYRRDLSNLILTDYLEFRWYVGGKRREVATLGTLQRGKVRLAATADKAGELLASFIKAQTFTVTSPKDLAERMASLARSIRDGISDELARGSNATLQDQLRGFREVLLHDLTDAKLMTDSYQVYAGPGKEFASHQTVNHRAGEYVRGEVYSNTVEGFFSQLKRSLDGTFHHVSAQHLDRYLSEFDFRYTTRKLKDSERTNEAIKRTAGKRLRYYAGKSELEPHPT